MRKRVFVGIRAGDNLASEIVLWQRKRRVKVVRWTSRDNLHLTLVPPWQEDDIKIVKARLDKLDLKSLPFEILFETISFGPNKKHPRLIWAEGPIPHQLVNLKRKIEEYLDIEPEKREFKFHITLGRFKERNLDSIKSRVKIGSIFWKMKIDSFHLFESKLSPQGAEYKVLKEVKLFPK